MRVYIAGPIQGVEHEQAYRSDLEDFVSAFGFQVYDPWKDEAIFYEHVNYDTACYLSRKDKQEVQCSDLLIAYLPACSIGTVREIEWALQANKRVVVICPMKSPSPHLVSVTTEFYRSLKEFKEKWRP